MSKEVKVKASDKVTVYGTGKSKFMPKNQEFKVHRILGEKLVAKGVASVKKTEDSK